LSMLKPSQSAMLCVKGMASRAGQRS